MRRNSRLLSERPLPRGLTVSISQILLRHFGDRLRRRSHFDQETIGSASVRMMAILAKKKVTGARAARAVEETLDLAASVVLTDHQRDMARSRIDVGQRAAKELCRRFDLFVSEVAALPPNSKHSLNQCVERSLACGSFDTEIFYSVLDAIAAVLPGLSPKVRADAAYTALFEGDGVNRERGTQSSAKLLWEDLDAETRRRCEMAIEARSPKDVSLFRMLADALSRIHPFRRGAPPSVFRDYARSVDRIGTSSVSSKGFPLGSTVAFQLRSVSG